VLGLLLFLCFTELRIAITLIGSFGIRNKSVANVCLFVWTGRVAVVGLQKILVDRVVVL
jgi:hypothetical protein